MARSNTANTANYLNSTDTSGLPTANPITMSAWFYPFTMTGNQVLVAISNAGADSYHALAFDGGNNYGLGDNRVVIDNDGVAFAASAGAVASANTWNHACSVNSGVASRVAYLNGVAGTADTTSRSPSGYNHANVACLRNTTTTFAPIDGRVCEVGIWNVALTADEVLMLSKGVSPLMVRPNNLSRYWPIFGNGSDERDRIIRALLSITGTMAKADHAPQFYPRGLIIGVPSSVAPKVLPADASAFTISGTAATLKVGRLAAAAAASFSISGQSAGLIRGYPLAAGAAAYAISAQAAALKYGRVTIAASASYSISATAAALRITHLLGAASASYAISSTAAVLKTGRLLGAASASYSISGTDVTLILTPVGGKTLAAESAAYAITSTAVSLRMGRIFIGAPSSFLIGSAAATLRTARLVAAASASFLISGSSATLTYSGGTPTPADEAHGVGQMATMNRWMGR